MVLRYAPPPFACRLLAQQTISTGATVSVLAEEGRTAIWYEGDQTRCWYVPLLREAVVGYSSALQAVAVYGEEFDPHDDANPRYALLTSLAGQVLYADRGVSFVLDDQWLVTRAYMDMRKHRRQTRWGYRDGIFCTLAHTFQCFDAHTYIATLVPYLFAEALLVGDAEEARSYLSPDLAAQWTALRAYVGEVVSLDGPPYLLPDEVVAWSDEQGRGKRFAFTMAGDKIDDVRRLDQ